MTTQTGNPIGRIEPVTPAPSILTVARPLQERGSDGAMVTITYDRWRTGVSWAPIGCQPSYNWARCNAKQLAGPTIFERDEYSEDGFLLKQPPEDNEVVNVDSFVIYTPLECPSYIESGSLDDDARALEEAHTAWGVARALWLGEGLPDTNPTLRNTAVDVTDSAGDTLQQGIAALLWAYEQATAGLGGAVLHIPSELLVAAGSQWITRQEGNLLRGPLNSLVSPGPGYPCGGSADGSGGFGPGNDSDGFQGTDDDTAWLYVTGPVEVAVGDVRVLPEREEERRDWYRRNDYHVWAERPAIVRFDVCNVFACEVANPAEPSGLT